MGIALRWIFAQEPKLVTERWEWPMAVYRGPLMKHAAYIICDTPYSRITHYSMNHLPIGVVIKKYNLPGDETGQGHRMLYGERFRALETAIAFTQQFLDKNPEWAPLLV